MSSDSSATARERTLQIARRAVAALETQDWSTLRSLCASDIVWQLPGRGPWAGSLHGIDSVIERWQQGVAATGRGLAGVLAVMASEDSAVVVQRPAGAGTDDALTVRTLCSFRDGTIVRMQTFYSDQYAVDGL